MFPFLFLRKKLEYNCQKIRVTLFEKLSSKLFKQCQWQKENHLWGWFPCEIPGIIRNLLQRNGRSDDFVQNMCDKLSIVLQPPWKWVDNSQGNFFRNEWDRKLGDFVLTHNNVPLIRNLWKFRLTHASAYTYMHTHHFYSHVVNMEHFTNCFPIAAW